MANVIRNLNLPYDVFSYEKILIPHFVTLHMGQILTKVKITLDKAGGFDTHYNKLTVAFDGTKQDLLNTIAAFLNDQKAQGLIDFEDLRKAKIKDDTEDKDGIFGDLVADIKDVISF